MSLPEQQPQDPPPITEQQNQIYPPPADTGTYDVFVSPIQDNLTREMIKNAFQHYGAILNVRIIVDKDGKSKGYCFIEMAHETDALRMVQELNGQSPFGKRLTVSMSTKYKSSRGLPTDTPRTVNLRSSSNGGSTGHQGSTSENQCVLFVYHVHKNASVESLRAHFSGRSAPIDCRIATRSDTGESKGYAFITYATPQEAQDAVSAYNNSQFMGQTLDVSIKNQKSSSSSHSSRPSASPSSSSYTAPAQRYPRPSDYPYPSPSSYPPLYPGYPYYPPQPMPPQQPPSDPSYPSPSLPPPYPYGYPPTLPPSSSAPGMPPSYPPTYPSSYPSSTVPPSYPPQYPSYSYPPPSAPYPPPSNLPSSASNPPLIPPPSSNPPSVPPPPASSSAPSSAPPSSSPSYPPVPSSEYNYPSYSYPEESYANQPPPSHSSSLPQAPPPAEQPQEAHETNE